MSPRTSIPQPPYRTNVSAIGEYVRHSSCQRRFRLGYNDRAAFRALPFTGNPVQAMDPVLQDNGQLREEEWGKRLEDGGFVKLKLPIIARMGRAEIVGWSDMLSALAMLGAGQRVYACEVQLEATLGAFELSGRIDFVIVDWEDATPRVTLVECKASRRDKTYQRLQVVLYRLMAQALMGAQPLVVAGHKVAAAQLRCCVVRIDEQTNRMPTFDQLLPVISSHQLEEDARRLLASDGQLAHTLSVPLDELPYQLNKKCDDCVFSMDCFPESARQRRLELLGLSPSSARLLRARGVETIDDLAALDPSSPLARTLDLEQDLGEPIGAMIARAKARRAKLPGKTREDFAVQSLPNSGRGQLPEHTERDEEGEHRMIRVYLSVHVDYTENRVAALCAHVTSSDHRLHTEWREEGGARKPDPSVYEQSYEDKNTLRAPQDQRTIVHIVPSRWTGLEERDTGSELLLLQSFFRELTDAIQREGKRLGVERAPLHFYLWGDNELKQLMDASTRVGSGMLSYLRELFGCRDSLEQLIYSSVGEEINQRFALGWTGRSLAIATSLSWFGETFHWTRMIEGEPYDLDYKLSRDLFDYKMPQYTDAQNEWTTKHAVGAIKETYEIRSHFYDQLSAPYLWAYWSDLEELRARLTPAGKKLDTKTAKIFDDYGHAAELGVLEGYLKTRVEAIRWVEERVKFKNNTINKPLMTLRELPRFKLGTQDAAQAAIDFLRLDHHVKYSEWLRGLLVPPAVRVKAGLCLPLTSLQASAANTITAQITPPDGMTLEQLRSRVTFQVGGFQRLHSRLPDLYESQSASQIVREGRTCVIKELDWDLGVVKLSVMSFYDRENYYVMISPGVKEGTPIFTRRECIGGVWTDVGELTDATLDPSISDFVANNVEVRLRDYVGVTPSADGAHALEWFNPERPHVPPQPAMAQDLLTRGEAALRAMREADGRPSMDEARIEIALGGLTSRIQLIQGPPGTGKTQLAATAIMSRISTTLQPGDIVLVGSHTHTAVNTLLARIDRLQAAYRAADPRLPPLALLKIGGKEPDEDDAGDEGVAQIPDKPRWSDLNTPRKEGRVIVIGATINGLLKYARGWAEPEKHKSFKDTYGRLCTRLLIIDEASMMVGAHFLALATLTTPDAQLMLAGDNRQLSPIVAHTWDDEDRPPVQRFRMHESAFDAVANLVNPDAARDAIRRTTLSSSSVRRDAIIDSYRLPAEVVDVLKPLYALDNITLSSARDKLALALLPRIDSDGSLDAVWTTPRNVFLVLHDEQTSRQINTLEIELVRQVLEGGQRTGQMKPRSVALITPHRAQRASLKRELVNWMVDAEDESTKARPVTMIDTVERLQGGEQETIIFSATASDPVAIAQNAEFILNLKRSNVAFSRPKQRLIILCSRTLLDHIPTDVQHYDAALLWKGLRALCAHELVCGERDGVRWRVMVRGN